MIAGVDLDVVIAVAGNDERWNFDGHERVLKHFGLQLVNSFVTAGYGDKCLGGLMRQHPVLVCSWSSCLDPSYAHETVVTEGRNFDPLFGVDPSYPWDRYVSRVRIYEREPS
jgi:hypothetical protein